MFTLVATLREIPPDNSGTHQLACKEISANDVDYDAAMAAVREAVPEGWQLLHVRTG